MKLLNVIAFGLLGMALVWRVDTVETKAVKLREWVWGAIFTVCIAPTVSSLALAGVAMRRGR